ncbi:SIS domain-containing protein [Lactobacillus sp. YT155]|uniref:SIS domain-containing protein n=1 Tax=Lactobacillus sp. YT155 TaxID=3060955 RepID=UPI00265EBCCE|nr:SIS domain-containing protein [Lactobacillus sp. YT155]MDO1605820.1 SIS domain-containing protein [Lactobacillus sp. YT155]
MGKMNMLDHILDTGRVLSRAYDERMEYGKDFIEFLSKGDFKKIYFTGSGTSYNAMRVVRNMFAEILKVEAIAIEPTIFTNLEDVNPTGIYQSSQILVIGLSQHGDSLSTCEAIKKAAEEGCATVGVSEQLGSPIEKLADQYLHLVCEKEQIGPETRGYTETLMQFYILAIEVAKKKGIINQVEYEKLDSDAKKLIENFDKIIAESNDWYEKNADELIQMTKSSIAGYSYNFPTAQEGRLKFFETFGRPSTAYEQEEQLHGPIRAYNDKNFIFLIGGNDGPEFERMKDIAAYYRRAYTEHVFVVTNQDIDVTSRDLKFSVKTSGILSVIPCVVPFQILSAKLSEAVGIDTSISPVKDRSISGHME